MVVGMGFRRSRFGGIWVRLTRIFRCAEANRAILPQKKEQLLDNFNPGGWPPRESSRPYVQRHGNPVAADVRRLKLKNQKLIRTSSLRLLPLQAHATSPISNSSTSRVVLIGRYCRINGASTRLLPWY